MSPQDSDPWDTGPKPGPFNADDVVLLVAAAILLWFTVAMWVGWI